MRVAGSDWELASGNEPKPVPVPEWRRLKPVLLDFEGNEVFIFSMVGKLKFHGASVWREPDDHQAQGIDNRAQGTNA